MALASLSRGARFTLVVARRWRPWLTPSANPSGTSSTCATAPRARPRGAPGHGARVLRVIEHPGGAPCGAALVICTERSLTIILEIDGATGRPTLATGKAIVRGR